MDSPEAEMIAEGYHEPTLLDPGESFAIFAPL
jgi:hypothetical protein